VASVVLVAISTTFTPIEIEGLVRTAAEAVYSDPGISAAGSANSQPAATPCSKPTSTPSRRTPRADPAGLPTQPIGRRTSPTPARACSGPPGHTTLALTRRTTTVDTLEDTTANPTTDSAAADAAQAAQWMQLPLRAFLLGPDLPLAVTLSNSGVDAVLLGRADTASVEVLRDGRIVREADTMLAVPVTDPTRQAELLRAALAAEVAARRALADTAEQRRTELDQLRASQARTLAGIRDYAIDQYRDDEINRGVLDAFLARFDLDPYQPRVKVTYTITGSFEVDSDNTDEVENNVEEYLGVDLDDVDDVVEYSDEFSVSVRGVEPVTN
jgi:hypothetical protein